MGKRTFSVSLALALVAGVFSALPAEAQAPTQVPATVNIEDISGDGNGVNDQGLGGACVQAPACIPEVGDNSFGGIGAADILKVWFTNSDTHVSAHILTTFPPPNMTPGVGLLYRVQLNDDCTYLQGFVPSKTYVGAQKANVREFCGDSGTTEGGEITVEALEDGTGITTLKYPFGLHPALVMGATLATPVATTRAAHGTDSPAAYSPQLDDTKVGIDYTISSGGPVVEPAPDPEEEPPGKNDPPGKGKKKGCKKGKGKKKGACPGKKRGGPKPPADSCPAYVPGEEGAEAETTIVTAAATEEKPVEVEFDAPAGGANDLILGVYDKTASLYQNIQVDAASADTGLYVRYEFPDHHDYDLYLNYPDGSTAANSGDFNVAPGHDLGGGSPDGGWEAGTNYEQVMGIRTADCGGYTARLVSYLTTGGATTLKVWLGPVVADPAAPSGGQQDAMQTFYSLMGL